MKQTIVFAIILAILTIVGMAAVHRGNGMRASELAAVVPKEKSMRLMIANTPELRTRGLSKLSSLPQDVGMVFVFDKPAIQCMWNAEVSFAVDVAFFDSKWELVNLETMKPHDRRKICSAGPAKYAVETNVDVLRKGK